MNRNGLLALISLKNDRHMQRCKQKTQMRYSNQLAEKVRIIRGNLGKNVCKSANHTNVQKK